MSQVTSAAHTKEVGDAMRPLCPCMYVCMCVRMNVCIYVCIYVIVCMYVYVMPEADVTQ
jgi:hypothetical protein